MMFQHSITAAILALCTAIPVRGQDLATILPIDTNVTVGKLENGLTYFIRQNHRPEKRAELRLVVNAGSILEEDDQLGLAHFIEHMAFNGTRNFPKQELVRYLESIGMQFGPDINAYTGFDETVYMLQLPTDSAELLERGFDILEDWAQHLSFDPEEIEKERGVVIEEWRLGRGAEARMSDKQFPILLQQSRYASRIPIGKVEILKNFSHEALIRYYRDWYRPDLMAVIAVGDFQSAVIEGYIQKHFAGVPRSAAASQRPSFPVPDHPDQLYAIASDPEATSSRVGIMFKQDVQPFSTIGDYRRSLIEGLYNGILNIRLDELARKADPPFLFGFSAKGSLVRTKHSYTLSAVVPDNGIEKGLDALLTEAARVRKYGLTTSELDRGKNDLMRSYENALREVDKTDSRSFASEYLRCFLTGESIPGIAYEYRLVKELLPGITVGELNLLADSWIREGNRVLMVNVPGKEGVVIPTPASLAGIFSSASQKEISAYVDSVGERPLVAVPPVPGRIVQEREIPELGVREWTLSNGVRVVLKMTDFKNDEVILSAYSPGGHSLVPDSNFIAAATAAAVVQEGGVGNFDQTTLRKLLTGKIVDVSSYIGELEEGFTASAAPADLTTMFELIYLSFTAPRRDSSAFLSLRTRMEGFLENRSGRPESVYEDTIQTTMAQYHIRRRPLNARLLETMNLQRSFDIYRDRFAEPGDFIFFIVGSFTAENLKPLATTFLGGIPGRGRSERWRDVGVLPPDGVVEKVVRRGIEQKSQVRLLFTGPFEWNRENRYAIQSMAAFLRIKMREALREDKGGTYGVSVTAATARIPKPEYRISIGFGCAPLRADELTQVIISQIDSLMVNGTTEEYIGKVQEIQRREYETNLRENRYWLSSLQFGYINGEDPRNILTYPDLIRTLTPATVQRAAQRYFTMKKYARFTLLPEEE